jgi:hypothetical protein
MQITIREYDDSFATALAEFNRRLLAGGEAMQFHFREIEDWLRAGRGGRVSAERFVAVDCQQIVRGGYILKRQDFWIRDRVESVGYFTLPISEGTVSRDYAPLGVRLLMDALRRQPLLYALGMGGHKERLPQLLKAAGWRTDYVPFFFRILRPARFLRNIVLLRRSPVGRCLLNALAFSGAGWLGVRVAQGVKRGEKRRGMNVHAEEVAEFGGWADNLWNSLCGQYAYSAVRDRATLKILYPAERTKFIRLQVCRDGRPIGWAVLLDTALADHRQFGNMRLGSLVDCFAHPDDAHAVVACVKDALESRGVDLIVSNQSHAVWCSALDKAGFLRGPSNFLFASSRELTGLLGEETPIGAFHLNRGDGDGPINL